MSKEYLMLLLMTALGFLSGSIMYCKIIPIVFLHRDICEESDDHNPGTANVFSICGIPLGILCLILELSKGFFPVFISCSTVNTDNILFAAVIAAPVLGHAIAPMNKFHGGKCIATSFGILLGLLPLSYVCFILAGTYILFSTALKINPNCKRSIMAFAIFAIISDIVLIYEGKIPIAAGCTIVSATAIIRHVYSISKFSN